MDSGIKNNEYQICNRCVMDTSASGILFDSNGICNYCTDMLNESSKILFKDKIQRKKELDDLVKKVKEQGHGKDYDCIMGVSGGVDSSTALVNAVNLGLRPLAVHMDNGWNTELAQNNISNLVKTLNLDLYTYVIDWEEYRNLMQSLFDADVIDVEILYDNAMLAVNYQMAKKYRLKYILAGTNQSTEGMRIPSNWSWFKYDKKNITAIAKTFGDVKIKSFPAIGTIDYILSKYIHGINWISFLDYFDYNKQHYLELLIEKYGYKPYPYKHYESIFTRFYQGYILPEKFKVDKRRVHLSTLIISGQITREEALSELQKSTYPDQDLLEDDKAYFIKKMNWTNDDLREYISRPEILHSDYPSEKKFWDGVSLLKQKLSIIK